MRFEVMHYLGRNGLPYQALCAAIEVGFKAVGKVPYDGYSNV